MDANRIIDTLNSAGLSIALAPENGLKVAPASSLTPELRELIRASKALLIDWLNSANDGGDPWRVSLALGTTPATAQRLRAASQALDTAQATTLTTADADWWPYATAMTGPEIDTFTARLDRFVDQGLSLDDGERLADRLAVRDRQPDDRRVCLECQHLHGLAGHWRCGNWQTSKLAIDAQLPGELVQQLQRCDGFMYETV